MQQFDSLKISVPADAIRSAKSDIWLKNSKLDSGTGLITETEQVKSAALPIGISTFSSARGGDYQLTFSAKALGQDYLRGITLNNWEAVLDRLKPVVDIDKGHLFEKAQVFTCDTTNNLQLSDIGYKHSKIYAALLSGRSNIRFQAESFSSKKAQGIIFRGTQQEKNRFIGYSKHLDLLKPENKEFLKSVDAAKMIQEAEKQIRFEVNHTAFKSIRGRLKIPDNSFKAALESTAPVNHNFLKKVMQVSDIKQTTLFGEWEELQSQGLSGQEFLMIKGVQSIIQELDYCDTAIKNLFQNMFNEEVFKYHWYKRKNNFKNILESQKAKQFGIATQEADLICNRVLENLLKAVA